MKNDTLEAAIFAVVVASITLFFIILTDLRDPFKGSWSVSAVEDAIKRLILRVNDRHEASIKEHTKQATNTIRSATRSSMLLRSNTKNKKKDDL